LSLTPCQPCHVRDDNDVTQTCSSNRLNKTYSNGHPNEEGGRAPIAQSAVIDNKSASAARAAAERRWNADLLRAFGSLPVTYGQIIEAVDAAIQSAATDAEVKRRGAGAAYITKRLKLG
jgi:hypothetical protein